MHLPTQNLLVLPHVLFSLFRNDDVKAPAATLSNLAVAQCLPVDAAYEERSTHLEGAAGPSEAVAEELAHAAAGGSRGAAGGGVAHLRLGAGRGRRARGRGRHRGRRGRVGGLLNGVRRLHMRIHGEKLVEACMATSRINLSANGAFWSNFQTEAYGLHCLQI